MLQVVEINRNEKCTVESLTHSHLGGGTGGNRRGVFGEHCCFLDNLWRVRSPLSPDGGEREREIDSWKPFRLFCYRNKKKVTIICSSFVSHLRCLEMSTIAHLCSSFPSLLKHRKSELSSDVNLKQFVPSVVYSLLMDTLVSLPSFK